MDRIVLDISNRKLNLIRMKNEELFGEILRRVNAFMFWYH